MNEEKRALLNEITDNRVWNSPPDAADIDNEQFIWCYRVGESVSLEILQGKDMAETFLDLETATELHEALKEVLDDRG